MELTIYDIIKKPIIGSKISRLTGGQRKFVLEVHRNANKPMIAQAVERLLNLKVEAIRIIVRKGKVRAFKRVRSMGKDSKRAIVTLKPGQDLSDIGIVPEGQQAQAANE
jgi:large subunit ribosomal protein L23